MPLTARKVLVRRAAMELKSGLIINIGSGIPFGIGSVAAEEGLGGFTTSVESGPMGGEVQEGLSFPGVANAETIFYQCDTIDMYDSGQEITYITERCVFRLTPEGPMITEIAKGIDLENDILAHMAFRPLVADEIDMMDERLFRPEKMGLKS